MAGSNGIYSLLRTVDSGIPGLLKNPIYKLVEGFGKATEVEEGQRSEPGKTHALGAMIGAVAVLAGTYLGCRAAVTRLPFRSIRSDLLKSIEWAHIAAMCWVAKRGLDSIYELVKGDSCCDRTTRD